VCLSSFGLFGSWSVNICEYRSPRHCAFVLICNQMSQFVNSIYSRLILWSLACIVHSSKSIQLYESHGTVETASVVRTIACRVGTIPSFLTNFCIDDTYKLCRYSSDSAFLFSIIILVFLDSLSDCFLGSYVLVLFWLYYFFCWLNYFDGIHHSSFCNRCCFSSDDSTSF